MGSLVSLNLYQQGKNKHHRMPGYIRNEKNMENLIACKYHIKKSDQIDEQNNQQIGFARRKLIRDFSERETELYSNM
jgi:hypothetical protein